MHDPLVVAFTIVRPWPTRRPANDARPGEPRWSCRYSWTTWRTIHKPGTWRRFWTVAGRGIYWPALVTVWHVEPGGRDSGEVCRWWRERDGQRVASDRWKWHAHHWRIQVGPLQKFRRWLLTRCEWCGGRSRKGDRVNVSHSWGGERGPWWRGERGLFHHDCSSIEHAHRTCVCLDPIFHRELGGVAYGRCARCEKQRRRHKKGEGDGIRATRVLAAVPSGKRDKYATAEAAQIWAEIRAAAATAAEVDNPS